MRRSNLRHLYSIIFIICIGYLLYLHNNTYAQYTVEGYQEKKAYHFFCRFHYGDNIANLKFFYDISEKLKENNIMVYYYYDNQYIKNRIELERYVDKETLTLGLLSEKPTDSVELWMGMDIDGINHVDFDVYFRKFYTRILSTMHLENSGIDVSLYQKEEYLLDIYEKLDDKYKNIDILVINAEPQSGQFAYNKDAIDAMCRKLASKYTITTTTCVDDSIPCTMRDKLTLQDIGAISTHAKYIVAVFSGPLTACFNQYTKDYVKKWILLIQHPIKLTEIDNILVNNVDGVYNIIEGGK